MMKNSVILKKLGLGALVFLSLGIIGALPARGDNQTIPKSVIDIEKILDFSGELKITLPSGRVKKLTPGQEFLKLPAGTLVTVLSGKCTALLSVNEITLPIGATARIIQPLVRGSKIVNFTGKIKIILPTGEEIILEAGKSLPALPPHTMIVVLSGQISISSEGEYVTLTEGETAEIEENPVDESLPVDVIELEPVSK